MYTLYSFCFFACTLEDFYYTFKDLDLHYFKQTAYMHTYLCMYVYLYVSIIFKAVLIKKIFKKSEYFVKTIFYHTAQIFFLMNEHINFAHNFFNCLF